MNATMPIGRWVKTVCPGMTCHRGLDPRQVNFIGSGKLKMLTLKNLVPSSEASFSCTR